MQFPDKETILATLDNFEGKLIHLVDDLIEMGYPREFVEPLAETFTDDPDDPHGMLRSEQTGRRLEHMRGVHDLDFLEALLERLYGANEVGYIAAEDLIDARGQRHQARQYAEVIRAKLLDREIGDLSSV